MSPKNAAVCVAPRLTTADHRRAAQPRLRLERPVHATGGRIERIEISRIGTDEDPAIDDRRLPVRRRCPRQSKRPFQFQPRNRSRRESMASQAHQSLRTLWARDLRPPSPAGSGCSSSCPGSIHSMKARTDSSPEDEWRTRSASCWRRLFRWSPIAFHSPTPRLPPVGRRSGSPRRRAYACCRWSSTHRASPASVA